MLVNCNNGCKLAIGTTIAKLDADTDQAICMECGDELVNISSYCKQNMKNSGDVIKKKKNRPFSFKCNYCNVETETTYLDGSIIGMGCKEMECSFSIPAPMVEAIKYANNYKDLEYQDEE